MLRNTVLAGGFLGAALYIAPACAQDLATSQPASQPTEAEPTSAPAAAPKFPPLRSILDFKELNLELGFEGSYDERATRFETGDAFKQPQRQVDRARRFEETVGVNSSGALFGENVALFDAGFRWGLTQDWYSELRPGPDLTERPTGDILEYDVNLSLLPRGKLSGTAYASRLDDRVPRAFQPSLNRSRERYGGGLFYNDATLPTRITFEHVWEELTSRTRDLNDDEQRGDNTLRYETTWQIANNHSLRLEYEYNDRHEGYSGSKTKFDTTRNYITLNHQLRFGEDDKSSWENLIRFQDESGDLARDQAEFSSRLRLQLAKELAANFGVQFLKDAYEDLATQTWRGEAGLTHQLGDYLTTTGQVYGLQQQAEGSADLCEWGALANAAFSRDNSLGRFSTNLSYNHTSTDTRNGQHQGIVIGESVTLRDPLASYLAQMDINILTIVVTDAGRTRTYLPVRDYVVVRIGHYTAITRVMTGAITNQQTVLVSYTYQVSDNHSIRRDRFDVRVQQDFKFGLTPYYAGSLQDESITHQDYLDYRDRNIIRHRVGATYRQRLWSVGAEYEYNDDSIDPYQALHGNGDVVLWQKAQHQLDAKMTLSHFRFRGEQELEARDTTLLDLGTTYRYFLARDLEANASAMYRYELDTLAGTTNGVDLTAAIDWKLGFFSLRFEAEYDLLSLPDSRDSDFSFWIKLRREIPIIARQPQ